MKWYNSMNKNIFGIRIWNDEHGETNLILGVRIIRKKTNILLSQEQYIGKVLRNCGWL